MPRLQCCAVVCSQISKFHSYLTITTAFFLLGFLLYLYHSPLYCLACIIISPVNHLSYRFDIRIICILAYRLYLTFPACWRSISPGMSWTKIANGWCRRGAPFANLVPKPIPDPDLNAHPNPNPKQLSEPKPGTLNRTGARAGRLS